MLRSDVKHDPAVIRPRESMVPLWAHHNRGLSINTNLGVGVGRTPVEVEASAVVEPPILDRGVCAAGEERAAEDQDVHLAQFESPPSQDVPPLPSLTAAPNHAHALPAAGPWYSWIAHDPPHVWLASPGQALWQSEGSMGVGWAEKPVPQRHWLPYSTPA